jgi:hypothetical protein
MALDVSQWSVAQPWYLNGKLSAPQGWSGSFGKELANLVTEPWNVQPLP